jgi:hypothetical protein
VALDNQTAVKRYDQELRRPIEALPDSTPPAEA